MENHIAKTSNKYMRANAAGLSGDGFLCICLWMNACNLFDI